MPAADITPQAAGSVPQKAVPALGHSDLKILAIVTATLWIITLAWQGVDLEAWFTSNIKSEQDAWVFGLVLAPFYFSLKGAAASWGATLGIANCLLAGHLLARRLPRRRRWLIVSGTTAGIFIGTPVALNANAAQRLQARYGALDSLPLPSLSGRAVELPSATPFRSTWQLPISCSEHCLALLVFGGASSVTLSFPGREGAPDSGPMALTYRLGPAGPGCDSARLRDYCARMVSQTLPADRIILTVAPVRLDPLDAGRVVARRLYAKDTRQPGKQPATLTRLRFAQYSGLLNVTWEDGALRLSRRELPLLAQDELDADLYRALPRNAVLIDR